MVQMYLKIKYMAGNGVSSFFLVRQFHVTGNKIAQQRDAADQGSNNKGEPEFVATIIHQAHQQEGEHYQEQHTRKE